MSLLGGRETKPGKLSVHNVHVFTYVYRKKINKNKTKKISPPNYAIVILPALSSCSTKNIQ